MVEFDIPRIVEDLKTTYNAGDVIVTSAADKEEYQRLRLSAIKPKLLVGKNTTAPDITGMEK